jgi:perosamine synthetase
MGAITMSESRLRLSPPLPLGVYLRTRSTPLPFPLDEPECTLFERARHGLWHGVQAIGLRPGDEVLVPAYHHGSEIEALLQAKLICRFYEATETLEPDQGELESLVGPRTRALYLIHYFGFPQDCSRWRAWCDEHGLLLVEDAAQAWLASIEGRPVGSFGDLAIFCLYKTVGLPDGAALVSTSKPSGNDAARRLGGAGVIGLHGAWLAARSRWAVGIHGALVRARRGVQALELDGGQSSDSESIFRLGHADSRPSSASLFLLPRLADAGVAARRRANYRLLLDELSDRVPLPFASLPVGASPLVFPLEGKPGSALSDRLERRGIDAEPFWPVLHPSLPASEFPGAVSWHKRFLALPVHQELRVKDIERVAASVHGRPRPPQLQLEALNGLEGARDEWSELAERSANVFATWEWASTWWRHFGEDRPLLTTLCRNESGRIIAVLPLYMSSSAPLRVVRFLGHGPADELGPVCAPRDRSKAATALRTLLGTSSWPWDIFLAEQLRGDEGWRALLGGRTMDLAGSPVIRFSDEGWDEFLSSLSARFRHEIRHDERKLAREHDLRFRLAEDSSRLDEDLDTLFALHAARWPNSAFGGRDQPFHRDFARCALDQGWLRLWFVEVDGRAVAAWYGFRFAGVEFHYQGGRDPAWERFSVGLIILAHSIREALADGMREYRFLRGGEQYKYRFAKEDPGLETVALAGGVAGRATLTTLAAARTLKDVARTSSSLDGALNRLAASRRRRRV